MGVSLFGVTVEVRPAALVPGPIVAALTYALLPRKSKSVATALASGLLWYEADLIHVVSHVVSARMADAPMDRVRWGVMPATLYDNNAVSPQQHIGRSLGGPIGSAMAMLICWVLWRALQGTPAGRLALIALIHNTIIALGSWLPIPFVDGGVIWKNIGKLER